jgi:hypothetical protein
VLDLILKNAKVVDGSGGPVFPADVANNAAKIRLMGDCSGMPTTTVCPMLLLALLLWTCSEGASAP